MVAGEEGERRDRYRTVELPYLAIEFQQLGLDCAREWR